MKKKKINKKKPPIKCERKRLREQENKYIKKFEIPIYERLLKVVVCEDIRTGLEIIESNDFEGEEDTVEATVIEDNKGGINVIIKPNANINTICHESLHVVTAVLAHAGLKLTDDSEEAYAYLIGWVSERIDKAIKLCLEAELKEMEDEEDDDSHNVNQRSLEFID